MKIFGYTYYVEGAEDRWKLFRVYRVLGIPFFTDYYSSFITRGVSHPLAIRRIKVFETKAQAYEMGVVWKRLNGNSLVERTVIE